MTRHVYVTPVRVFLFSIILAGCGDNRPPAAGAAHVYNSTDEPVEVRVQSTGGHGATFTIATKQGEFVPLRKADTYVISVLSPPAQTSYHEEFEVVADDTRDMVFDIGSVAQFALVPTYHAPQNMPDNEAHAEVESIKQIGDHQVYYLGTPASRHILPRGVYYSFKDDIEEISRTNKPGSTIEVRYKLSALYD
jgi:hypothetical protein